MATKRLSRTVLEGGRTSEYRDHRVAQNALLRRREKHACRMARDAYNNGADVQDVDVEPVLPASMYYSSKFTDKLSPVWRYLRSRHGRLWDDVWSELTASFDIRGLAGYHVLIQHVRNEVEPSYPRSAYYTWRPRFWVDEDGVLHCSDYDQDARMYRSPKRNDANVAYAEFASVTSYEYVDVDEEGRVYWVKHIDPWFDECTAERCDSCHAQRKSPRTGKMVRVHREPRVIWSRVRELTTHEYALWQRMSTWHQDRFKVRELRKHDEMYRWEQQRRIHRVLLWRIARTEGNPLAPSWYYGTQPLPELGIR